MSTLDEHFDYLKSQIEPTSDRTELAGKYPDQVRDFLQKHEDITTVTPHSRLSGSYLRKTAIKDIKDVDILLFVHPDYLNKTPNSVLLTLATVLKELPKELNDIGIIEPAISHQRRSVRVELESAKFKMDIVPVVAKKNIDEILQIPDKNLNEWGETNPLGYATQLSKLNQKHGEKVIPLIKLIKHWRDVQMTYMRPKSFWLEATIYHLINDGLLTTDDKGYGQLFRDAIAAIFNRFANALEGTGVPRIPDPMLGTNISKNWDRSAFESFMNRVNETKKWADKAVLEDADSDKAISLWQKIFNADGKEWFPNEIPQNKVNTFRLAALSNSIFVEKETGKISIQKTGDSYIQSPPHRSYGISDENF